MEFHSTLCNDLLQTNDRQSIFNSIYFTHSSNYSAKFIFPLFPRQNKSFSLTSLFTQNTNVIFQSLAITLETKAAERI